jgi:glycosyltransferase involved in cell wall biosynthesis
MKGEFIIHFGGNIRGDWETGWQREQELATRISKDNKVLYIERLGSINRNPLDLCRRLWNRVKRNSNAQISVKNLSFYFPFIIPIHGIFFIRKLNSLLLSLQIKRKLKSINPNGAKSIIWVKNPAEYVLDVLPHLNGKLTIYDCHHVYFHDMPVRGKELDEKMAQAADLVFADSTAIYAEKVRLNPATYQIPQGVDLSLFEEKKENKRDFPEELKTINPPLIGYIGHYHPSFDFDLVSYLAEKRPHWSFVLVGNFQGQKERFNSQSNVHFLGPRRHEELPNYLKRFHICIIPYLVNEHTQTVCPTKLFEYLAAGKPVVSTYMPDLVAYEEYVRIAKDYHEFLTHIENFLEEQKKESKRFDFYSLVKENTWDQRLDHIYQIISIHLNGKRSTLR